MTALNGRQGALLALLRMRQQDLRLDASLEQCLRDVPEARDRSLARELGFGVMRYLIRLEAISDLLLQRPLKTRDSDVLLCLLMGLYQILHTRVPDHAAVTESVKLVRWRGKDWARGLVNAVLRRFLRESESICRQADRRDWVRLAYPRWLLEAIGSAWPDDRERILSAGNAHPPLSLRVNRRRIQRQTCLRGLREAGIEAEATRHSPDGLRLARPMDAALIPGFSEGRVSVQDEAAQLAAGLLDVHPGQRVLDACAAPGGKTAHLLEFTPGPLDLTALELQQQRLQILATGLQRLGLEANLCCADARQTSHWWQRRPFDRILLDAPCSATGVIRRHPDIRHRRGPDQVQRQTRLQWQLLEALWPTLAPGGKLLYATCSILPAENQLLIREFAGTRADAEVLPITDPWGRETAPGRQILSGEDDMDGFYYALLGKKS